MEKSDYQKRIALEKRGVDTEDLTKRDLQNERKLIQRAKMDRELERQGMLNYQTGAGGKQAPPPQSLAPHVQPSLYPTPTPPQSLAPQTGGGSSVLQDPVTGKEYYSQGQQYYLNGQPRVSNSSVWLNGQPKTASPLSAGGGLATLQDAVNGQVNWSDVSVEQRKKALSDPNFYANNQITKYPKWMQQEILADPNFDWKKLPKWQKYYFDLSSSPLGMGAVQGGLMGSFGGPVAGVGGTALGAGLGWAAGKSGYDATKEAWQQTTRTAKVFGYLNWAAEQAEKVVGLGVQAVGAAQDPNVELKDVFTREGWDAGAVTFETITPAIQAALKQDSIWNGDGEFQMRDLLKFLPSLDMTRRLGDLVLHPEKYKGDELYLGADMPVALDQNFQERINEARERIKQGENYREVMMDFQTGVMGQLGDMAGQAIADPLNVLPQANAKLLGKAAELSGNKVAAEAFKGVDAPVEGLQRYKNLVQTGEALKIDPNFKVDEMGALARWAAGVNKQGQIKAGPFNEAGLLDAPKKNKTGFLQEMVTLPPQSRAQTGAGMFYENIGALLTRFDDPHEAGKYLRALSNNDMETWRELGSRFAESPEFYTVLPALRDFNAKALDGIVAAWDNTQMNRDTLTRVADVLGQEPGKLLEDWTGKDTFEQDFGRIRQRLEASSDPAARALLGEMQAGRFTPDSLKQMVDVFTGDGAAAWHPNQAKAMMLDALGEHFDKWVADKLMLDQTPEAKSAFFRTAALVKSAQSILLLGASPGYAIQNGLSNMVHRAATGNFGYLTPTQINSFMDKFGISPARFEEGVGIGGMVEQAAGKGKVHSEAQIKAVKGKGALADAREKVSSLSGKMPFSKLSSWFEKNEGRQAFVIGMKQFWGQSWRRGKGFKTMSPELVAVIRGMGVDPNHFYAAIEAGLNQADIEKALMGRQEGVQARALVDAVAQKKGLTASQAADMLEKVGVLDVLDSFLKGQTTNDGKRAAFRRAERVAQDWMDRQAGEDLKAQAEHVAQRVAIEQPAAAFEVIQKTLQDFTDTWMEHYYDLGEVTRNLEFIPDEAMKSKAYDHAYEVSGERFRRIDARSAASWQGIFEAWGKSNDPRAKEALSAMGEMRSVMADAYTQMRDIRKATHEKHRGNLRSSEFFDDVAKDQKTIDQIFKRAFETRKLAEKRAGKALGDIYESLYGPAAGEAARLWWDDVLKMNDEIVKREGEFRKSIEGLSKEERAAAKQKYYAETKALQIAEQLRINEEGLARLERVVRGGGGKGGQLTVDGGPRKPTGPVSSEQLSVEGQRSQVESEPLSAESVRSWAESQYARPAQTSLSPQPELTPSPPKGEGSRTSPQDEINGLMAAAEQRRNVEAAEQRARVNGVWDVAEEYVSRDAQYSRASRNDLWGLIGALRKAEYGGMPDLTSLDDPRVTPEFIREVMETRKRIKEEQAAIEAAQVKDDVITKPRSELPPRVSDALLSEAGRIADVITGSEAGRRLFAEGEFIGATASTYPKWYNDLQQSVGGRKKLLNTLDKIMQDAGRDKGVVVERVKEFLMSNIRHGDKETGTPPNLDMLIELGVDEGVLRESVDSFNEIAGTNFTLEDVVQGKAFADSFDFNAIAEIPFGEVFDMDGWKKGFDEAAEAGDLTAMYERMGELPEELSDQLSVSSDRGESWNDYVSRVADEVVARVEEAGREVSIAESVKSAKEAVKAQEVRGEYAMTRNLLKEKFVEAFDITEEQATAWMEISDGVAGWYERAGGGSGEEFYSRYYKDVVSSDQSAVGGEALEQGQLQPVNRRMTAQEVGDYARALVRGGADELRRAVQNEPVKADRISILDAAYRLDPKMAEQVAKDNLSVLFQDVWHGSPYKFDKFTLDKIGTGEGNQAYGWGLYFAGDESVANYYRSELSKQVEYDRFYNGKKLELGTPEYHASSLVMRYGWGLQKARKEVARWIREASPQQTKDVASWTRTLEVLNEAKSKKEFTEKATEGQLYRVEIPDDNYLLWDKPLSEQSQAVKDIVEKLLPNAPERLTGEQIYNAIGGKGQFKTPTERAKHQSLALKEAGINGIKYLDATSRGKGEGTFNYVVFDDDAIKILETYYQATGGGAAKGAVVFDGDGIKATIHAFEGKDFSTVVHENAHVFRRMLSDVAERTGDAKVARDLKIIEDWVGVESGKWNRAAEEKFARGFERYLAEGKAPSPALKRAFDSFKSWMLAIYKSFTGNAIDVKLTPSVKAVFDNLVAGDDATRNIGIFSKDLYVDADALRANQVKRNEAIKARLAEIREKSQVSSSTLFQRAEAVDTPEFKNWFGKSKVVGEDGKPLVVYHGTGADFQVFDAGKVGLNFSDKEGFFFTDNVSHDTPLHGYDSGGNEIRAYYEDPYSAGGYAKNAARQTGQGAAVMPVYLKLENPMTTKDVADMFSLKKDDPFDGAHPQDYLDDNKQQLLEIAKEEGYDGIWLTNGKDNVYVAFEPTQVKSVANRGTFDPTDPNILFQDADLPVGSLDAASGFMPQSAVMEEGWGRHIKPLLEAMEEEAISRQQSGFSGEGAMKDMSPEGQGMLRKYMKEVQNDMATSKLAAMRWGEQRRDFAMLNYNRRYGFDRWLDVVYPYQFFYSRSLMTWAARGLDTPAWFSNYARLRMQQQRYERDIPERLRNKIKIPAPWMPDWMGDALYIDPLQSLFTPANFLRPFERMERDKNMQQVEAERIMQEWAEDGTYSQEQIMQAAQSQSGSVWERAQQEAVMRRESEISSPMDFFNTMFGPAWYLSTPMNLLGIGKGEPNKMTNLPLTNTARGIEAVTQGTWAEPVGQVIGLLGKPEEWARKKLGLPTMGEYGEYYTKRQLANMVIEGKITSEQAQLAMIEKQGALWDEATQRVKLELAMRVPTMASLYAGLHGKNVLDGLTQAGAAALPSLFGSGLLPAGELEYRGLKQEWDEAWKKFDAGDKQAVTAFFDEHPEYEAYLAKGKDDDELMQSFLVGQVWDGYMALGPTNQKAARAQMGELFGDAFLNKETRSYESIPTEQLMEWARMLNKMTPQLAPQASPQMTPSAQFGGSAPTLNLYDKNVTAITDEFFNQRSQYFPDYYEVQNGYYALPKSGRAGYLLAHPELKEYWDWKKKWEKSYPDLVPIMKGQVFKTVDTSTWPPGLETYVQAYAYGGERLPKGAYKALEQQWIMEGRPYDDLNVWLNSQVVPAMLYQDQPSP